MTVRLAAISLLAALAVMNGEALAASEKGAVCRLVGNDTPAPGLCTLDLALPKAGTETVSPNATLYFNFGRKPARTSAAGQGVHFEHVNGDLFKVSLDTDQHAAWPAALRLTASGAVRNVTDMPAGFFFADESKAEAPSIVPLSTVNDLAVLPPAEGADSAPVGLGAPTRGALSGGGAPILPQPRRFEARAGAVDLAGLPVEAAAELSPAVAVIQEALSRAGGPAADVRPTVESGVACLRLRVDPSVFDTTAVERRSEAYRLVVDQSGVRIVGGGAAGVFYGAQSLAALLANESAAGCASKTTVPAVVVDDAPPSATAACTSTWGVTSKASRPCGSCST